VRVYVTTVIRGADIESSGCIYCLDWAVGKILNEVPVPVPSYKEVGPRGSKRGGRGIINWGNEIVVSNYDSLLFYDKDLNYLRKITHPLFCGIHEIDADDEGIWVSSTGIESVLLVEPESGEVLRKHFVPGIAAFTEQSPYVEKGQMDLEKDYRNYIYARSEMSTHINCVEHASGATYALLSNLGAVIQVEPDYKLTVLDNTLKEPHNLLFLEERLVVNDTGRQTVKEYDLNTGKLVSEINLNKLGLKIKKPGTILKGKIKISTAGWLRGMSHLDGHRILVGISPSTVVELDMDSGKIVKTMKLSNDVNNSIHGLFAFNESIL